MVHRIEQIAERLLREGYVDNEPDARLAAVMILAAGPDDDQVVVEACADTAE